MKPCLPVVCRSDAKAGEGRLHRLERRDADCDSPWSAVADDRNSSGSGSGAIQASVSLRQNTQITLTYKPDSAMQESRLDAACSVRGSVHFVLHCKGVGCFSHCQQLDQAILATDL